MTKSRKNLGIGIIVFTVCMLGYLVTLCPTVYVGDSGEYTTSACLLGISHPPGYPLYSIIGKIFTVIPFGSMAARVNSMSAVFAALTVLLLYFIVLEITESVPSAACAGLLLGFSLTFWSQAVAAEVYTMNAFFTAATFLILLRWERDMDVRFLYLFSFVYGISLTNHYIMILFAPAYAYFILVTFKTSGTALSSISRKLPGIIMFFLLGLFIYLYLPIRSSANPLLDWGNPENLNNFINHIKRVQYKEFEFGKSFGLKNQMMFLWHFIVELSAQFTLFLGWLGIAGVWMLLKKRKIKLLVTSALIIAANTLGLIFLLDFQHTALSMAIFEVYYLPSYIIFALWMGYAVNTFLEKLKKSDFLKQGRNREIIIGCLALILPVVPLMSFYPENNKSNYYLAYDYGINILKTMEKGARFITFGDNQIFILAYLQFVEGQRRDISIFNKHGIIFPSPYTNEQFEMSKSQNSEAKKRINREIIEGSPSPVYFSIRVAEQELDMNYVPQGLLARSLKEGEVYETESDYWEDYRLRGISEGRREGEYWTRDIGGEYYFNLGKHYIEKGQKAKAVETFKKASEIGYDLDWLHSNLSAMYHGRLSMLDEAEKEARISIRLNPLGASPHNELGIVYFKRGDVNKAIKEFKKALEIDPNCQEARYNYNALLTVRGL